MSLKRNLTLFSVIALLGLTLGCAAPQAQVPAAGSSAANSGVATSSPSMQTVAPTLPVLKESECKFPKEWIGKKIDRDAVKAAAKAVRILHPNDPATMDYSPERLNVIIDSNDIVTEVNCG